MAVPVLVPRIFAVVVIRRIRGRVVRLRGMGGGRNSSQAQGCDDQERSRNYDHEPGYHHLLVTQPDEVSLICINIRPSLPAAAGRFQ